MQRLPPCLIQQPGSDLEKQSRFSAASMKGMCQGKRAVQTSVERVSGVPDGHQRDIGQQGCFQQAADPRGRRSCCLSA